MNMIESVLGVPASGNGYSVTGFEMTTLSDMCPPRVSVDMDQQLFKNMANRANGTCSVNANVFFGNSVKLPSKYKKGRKVEKVIYNPPATIVWFNDGDKIVSKVEEGDEFDWETGLAICVLKKRMDRKKYNRLQPYFFEGGKPLWDVLVRMECPNGEWEKIKKEWKQK